jgi:energy-coupling factor transport system permease protein
MVYFVAVFVCGMMFMHPVFQAIALAAAVVYSIVLKGKRGLRFNVWMLPLMLAIAVINPLFNHAGVTILFYLNNGNPVTLESILYGAAAACMYVTMIIWFSCYNAVMTSDKFIYLFGRAWPALSLVLSMALRFVPRYADQLRRISLAQRAIGRDFSQGAVLQKARHGIRILSIMTTWALENAIETADSMKARGYGLPGRTSFSLYRFDRRDGIALAMMAALIAVVAAGAWQGHNTIRFFPSLRIGDFEPGGFVIYAAYALLCFLPVIIQLVEEIQWTSIASKT